MCDECYDPEDDSFALAGVRERAVRQEARAALEAWDARPPAAVAAASLGLGGAARDLLAAAAGDDLDAWSDAMVTMGDACARRGLRWPEHAAELVAAAGFAIIDRAAGAGAGEVSP